MLANFIAFQLGWFACVLGASHKLPALGSAFALVIVAWHLARCRSPWIELRLILSAALIGMVFDSSLAWSGWIGYDSGILLQGAAPYWIIVMWMLFATTLNASLSWLKRSFALAAVCGAVAGPLAYWGGAKLGALTLPAVAQAMIALCVGWAILTPVLLWLAGVFNGYARSGPNFSRPVND